MFGLVERKLAWIGLGDGPPIHIAIYFKFRDYSGGHPRNANDK